MDEHLDYRALALAGVVQAAALVHDVANGRDPAPGARRALLLTVPTRNAADMNDVFPDPGAFGLGVLAAQDALSGGPRAPEVLRYTLQLIELSRLLAGVPQVIEKLGRLVDALDPADPQEGQLSHIYQQTISTLGKRIQVTGDPRLLSQEAVADSIRALLLAGIRLAWLWQQLGGRRWHLILRRRAVLVALRTLDPSGAARNP